VEDLLFQMMTGAMEVLNATNCALVGGHTGEGKELALGFAINGLVDDDLRTVLRKGGLKPGDALILTKPMGTGTLFAAHARTRRAGAGCTLRCSPWCSPTSAARRCCWRTAPRPAPT
jgi:selenide,water dikinase